MSDFADAERFDAYDSDSLLTKIGLTFVFLAAVSYVTYFLSLNYLVKVLTLLKFCYSSLFLTRSVTCSPKFEIKVFDFIKAFLKISTS